MYDKNCCRSKIRNGKTTSKYFNIYLELGLKLWVHHNSYKNYQYFKVICK